MSADDFTNFLNALAGAGHGKLASAAEKVYEWVTLHPTAEYVEASDVLDVFEGTDPIAVAEALTLMSERGLMAMKFAVAPRLTYTRLETLYDSIKAIPNELQDWKLGKFEKDDAEVFPVFVPLWGHG
jgi:hypothetical protein